MTLFVLGFCFLRALFIYRLSNSLDFGKLFPGLLDVLPNEVHDLIGDLRYFLTKLFPVGARFEARMKFHNLLCLGKKFFILRK